MEVNEMGEFKPTPMPAVFFDHDATNIEAALGINKIRKRELMRAMEDLFEDKEFHSVSTRMEAVLELCQNEQERIVCMYHLGQMRSGGDKGFGMLHITDGKMRFPDGMPDEVKEMLKAIIKKRLE